ncbi:FtsX-like permease family protein [Alkalibacterium iburiense]|uniref:FtsX-like permease family protein n=1 Tax=Alkalibacterium iburiense TaxID=290589 RepID=A0ABN0XPJ9_9LACT
MSSFSFKLAWRNIKANRQLYVPYVVSSIITIAMFYMMSTLLTNDFVHGVSATLPSLFAMGTAVIGFFSVIFILYTNSFLMKRRKKELGLYNILGLGKRHITRVLAIESILVSGFSILAGILTGLFLGQLMFLFLNFLLRLPVAMEYSASWESAALSAGLFSVIYIIALLYNSAQVQFSNPIHLLKGGNKGEKEPKSSPILFIIGLISLIAGYWISLTIEDPISAITQFFLAVLLVIIGTYLLYTAGSIIVLKALKKNKKIYYKPGPFIAISGMLYRMKQHAVGLANISILSVMVIISVSTTVTLFVGTEETLSNRFPEENTASIMTDSEMTGEELSDQLNSLSRYITDLTHEEGLEIETITSFKYINLFGSVENNTFINRPYELGDGLPTMLMLLPMGELNGTMEEPLSLEEGQVYVYADGVELEGNHLELGSQDFETKELETLPNLLDVNLAFTDALIVVTPNLEVVDTIVSDYNPENDPYTMNWSADMYWSTTASDEEKLAYGEKMERNLLEPGLDIGVFYESRSANREEWFSMNGGFLFIGIFLGSLFTIGAALITYFKQVSEGYDDRERVQIMQKVGLDKATTRQATRSQIVWMFTLPLLVAAVHTAFAYPIIHQMLLVFGIMSHRLLILCTLGVVGAFALLYWIIYRITSRVYLKIVE